MPKTDKLVHNTSGTPTAPTHTPSPGARSPPPAGQRRAKETGTAARDLKRSGYVRIPPARVAAASHTGSVLLLSATRKIFCCLSWPYSLRKRGCSARPSKASTFARRKVASSRACLYAAFASRSCCTSCSAVSSAAITASRSACSTCDPPSCASGPPACAPPRVSPAGSPAPAAACPAPALGCDSPPPPVGAAAAAAAGADIPCPRHKTALVAAGGREMANMYGSSAAG